MNFKNVLIEIMLDCR